MPIVEKGLKCSFEPAVDQIKVIFVEMHLYEKVLDRQENDVLLNKLTAFVFHFLVPNGATNHNGC